MLLEQNIESFNVVGDVALTIPTTA